ncbi:MAG: ATP-binding protein [Chloroflexota bacterium]|nr:ATP-binding protein [Chloroflexota bacterium]
MVTPSELVMPAWRAGFSRASDIEFRELLEQLPAAAYTTDGEGLITYYNRHALLLWGRAPLLNDPVDRYCGSFRLFDTTGTPIAHEQCWMALALHQDRSYNGKEILIERADGSRRTVLAHANPIHDERGRVRAAVNVLVDITDRSIAEMKLREADEAKTEFLAMLAHELRNPLAAMRSAVELAARAEGEATRRRAHDTLERQVSHLGRIVGDLVDIARITRRSLELRREPTDLAPIIEQAIETCRPMIEDHGQRLDVSLPSEPIRLEADAVRLSQLIGNLLGNASKYSAPNATIWLSAVRQGSEVVISVLDEGIGIAPETQEVIFDMFARAAAGGEDGLGVGLTLAQHLARLHGGSIEVASGGKGQGSEFRVHLPILLDMKAMAALTEPAQQPYRGQRILVVDDNRDAADALASLLELEGNEAHVAHDGATAVELAESLRPDVMLLDIGLPKLNGYEVARRVRGEPWGGSMLLVALTGWGQPEEQAKSVAAGFDHHLVKPADIGTVTELLARHAATAAR